MQNLISAQEAFNAVVAGKHVLCRAAGELMDFDDLDQFPATIFAKPGYEFCIKIETIEVAGITFTKPLTLDEIAPNMDIFVIESNGFIHHYKYAKCGAQDTAINQGFAQRDEDNAKLQIKALCSALGRTANLEQIVVPAGIHPKEKQPRKPRTKKETNAFAVAEVKAVDEIETSSEVIFQKFSKEIEEAVTTDAVLNLRYTFSANSHLERENILELSKLSEQRLGALDPKQYAEPVIEAAVTTTTEGNIVSFDSAKADAKTEKSLRERIAAAEKIEDLEALLPELQKLHGESGHNVMTAYEQKSTALKQSKNLSIEELKGLTLAAEEALSESEIQRKSDALYASFQTEITRSINVETVNNVLNSIESNNDLTPDHKIALRRFCGLRKQDILNAEYDEKLDDLTYRASIAKTPAEANALIRYTAGWTEEQLAPLHRAISKRLTELNKDSVTDPAPSLMRNIQNAADLTTLDALEIDVSARAPDMQKVLMAEVSKRRFELENM